MWSKYPDINEELVKVEAYIKKSIVSRNKLLNEVTGELVEAGGKRIRPAFVIISAKFGKYDTSKAISLAGALEILHTATLVHDDIIDNSKLRRGRVTVSEKYGTDMAVYTGDFLFTKAVLMLSHDISIEKLDIVARAIKTICEGEVDQYRDRYNIDVSVFTYLKRISKKTAVLFQAACGLGGFLAECTDNVIKELARFGFYYGMAFQIRDDLLDFLSDVQKEGKPICKDIIEGTVTLPVIYSIKKNRAVKEFLSKCLGINRSISTEDSKMLFEMIREEDGTGDAKRMLVRYVDRGLKAIGSLPDNPYREILREQIIQLLV